MKRQNVRTLSLVVCTFTYLLVGAAVFDALESDTEEKRHQVTNEMRSYLLRRYNISDPDYKLIETVIIESRPHKAGPQWKFSGAFYFSVVVVAVIGYGHSTPATISGKAFCIAYAMIGIPLGIFMFQSIGERLNKLISVIIRHAKSIFKCKKTEATEIDLMAVTGFLSSVILMAGAAVFSRYEGWSYMDSFYYSFVTLTTIGFGDFVALQNDRALTNRPGYVAFSLIFILFGLAVVAACMNLLVLRFMTMNAEDVKRDDVDSGSCRGALSLDGEMLNYSNGLSGAKVSVECKTPDNAYEFDQVSVCSCSGCSCFGNRTTNIFAFDDFPSAMDKNGGGSRRNSGRWPTKIHVQESRVFQNWRRPSTSIRRSGSRLSRLTFGIDSVWSGPAHPPPIHPQFPNTNDIYDNFRTEFFLHSREKRASI